MLAAQVQGTTAADRHVVVAEISDTVSSSGGWIIDHKMFSDLMISFVIECSAARLGELWQALGSLAIDFSAKSNERVAALAKRVSGDDDEVTLLLNLTFSGGTGDLRRVVPAVPG